MDSKATVTLQLHVPHLILFYALLMNVEATWSHFSHVIWDHMVVTYVIGLWMLNCFLVEN